MILPLGELDPPLYRLLKGTHPLAEEGRTVSGSDRRDVACLGSSTMLEGSGRGTKSPAGLRFLDMGGNGPKAGRAGLGPAALCLKGLSSRRRLRDFLLLVIHMLVYGYQHRDLEEGLGRMELPLELR